jgi:hypothetical protein
MTASRKTIVRTSPAITAGSFTTLASSMFWTLGNSLPKVLVHGLLFLGFVGVNGI